jgi:Tfp pilus assembly protein PilO
MPNKFNLPEQYRKYYRSLEPILAKPKTRMYSTVIFIFLVVALFGWYAVKPTIQTILYLRREIKDKTAVNKKMDEKIEALIEAQSILESIGQRTSYIQEATPANPDAIDVVRQLRDIATTAGASISAIQIASAPMLPSATASASKSYTVKQIDFAVSMSIEGNYESLSTFLRNCVAMRRIITIESISFTPNKKQATTISVSPSIQLVLKMSSYYATP